VVSGHFFREYFLRPLVFLSFFPGRELREGAWCCGLRLACRSIFAGSLSVLSIVPVTDGHRVECQ